MIIDHECMFFLMNIHSTAFVWIWIFFHEIAKYQARLKHSVLWSFRTRCRRAKTLNPPRTELICSPKVEVHFRTKVKPRLTSLCRNISLSVAKPRESWFNSFFAILNNGPKNGLKIHLLQPYVRTFMLGGISVRRDWKNGPKIGLKIGPNFFSLAPWAAELSPQACWAVLPCWIRCDGRARCETNETIVGSFRVRPLTLTNIGFHCIPLTFPRVLAGGSLPTVCCAACQVSVVTL